LKVVCDTGPLLVSADRRSRIHRAIGGLVNELGRRLVILDVVLAEADYMLRKRVGAQSARALLDAVARGAHSAAFLSPGLLSRAAELDARYADLDLGLVDTSIMAYAERHRLPILTFDFRDFRATTSAHGPWHLVLNERQLASAARPAS
jgi:predicted nucleic acid-binding protein